MTIADRTLPRIVCLDCMRDVAVTHSDWCADLATDTRGYIVVECHERRIARIDYELIDAITHGTRPVLWSELRFVPFDQEQIEAWEAQATQLMDRVRIVTEHFKAGGR